MDNRGHEVGCVVLFLVGEDYHLGDLLWLTAVLSEYRRQRQPKLLVVGCPDRPISRILEHNPLIDRLLFGKPKQIKATQQQEFGDALIVYDLHIWPLAVTMLQDWRHHLPWLYYRDLWLQPRGQWLATLLHLGKLTDYRPSLHLTAEDRRNGLDVEKPYVVLAPAVGSYSIPLMGRVWEKVKGWENQRWEALARGLEDSGFLVITMAAAGQKAVPGTLPVFGLPIRKAASVIEGAQALISVESGLWFVAAALRTPFLIVPWWLPDPVDWAGPMNVPHALIRPREGTADNVLSHALRLVVDEH